MGCGFSVDNIINNDKEDICIAKCIQSYGRQCDFTEMVVPVWHTVESIRFRSYKHSVIQNHSADYLRTDILDIMFARV